MAHPSIDTMDSLLHQFDAFVSAFDTARALPKADPTRVWKCAEMRDGLVQQIKANQHFNPGNVAIGLYACSLLQKSTISEGRRVLAFFLLCHCFTPNLPLLLQECHKPASAFVQDCARLSLSLAIESTLFFSPDSAHSSLLEIKTALEFATEVVGAQQEPDKYRCWYASLVSHINVKLGPGRDLLLGSILWQGLGDAIGFLVEGRSKKECQLFLERVVRSGSVHHFALSRTPNDGSLPRYLPKDGSRGPVSYHFGQYTDDTQLMRELLKSLAESGGLDLVNYSHKIVTLFKDANLLLDATGRPLPPGAGRGICGYGGSTRKAAQALHDGVAWTASGPKNGQGNGGCMRVGPLGVVFYHETKEMLAYAAMLQSHPTHPNIKVKGAAIAVAMSARIAAKSALSRTSIDCAVFCAAVSAVVHLHCPVVAAGVQQLTEWISLPVDQAQDAIIRYGLALGDDDWHGVPSSGAVQTALWAIFCFLLHPDNPMECLCTAIGAGGGNSCILVVCCVENILSVYAVYMLLFYFPKIFVDTFNF